MTRYTSSYTVTVTTTAAAYNTFHGKFSAALQAVLTKTSDTGQFVPGTTAGNTTLGTNFEVYAFTDTLQATKPLYLRIDYVGGANYDIYLTLGTGTDGAGNISGQILTQAQITQNGTATYSGSAVRYIWASSDGSYLNFMFGLTGPTTPGPTYADNMAAITIERTRDADGTPNGNGINIYRWRAWNETTGATLALTTTTYQGAIARSFDTTAPLFGPEMEFNALLPMKSQVNSYSLAAASQAYPVYGFTPTGVVQGASKALMIGFTNDWPLVKQAINVTHYGVVMSFMTPGLYAAMATGSITTPAFGVSTQAAVLRTAALTPLFRWE